MRNNEEIKIKSSELYNYDLQKLWPTEIVRGETLKIVKRLRETEISRKYRVKKIQLNSESYILNSR